MLLLWDMHPDPDKKEMDNFCESSAYKMKQRFTKSLYYGELTDEDEDDNYDDGPSLPLTDIAVDYFQDVTPRKLGKVDRIFASSVASRACASPCSVVMSMIYAKRLRHRNPEYLSSMSSSDLFLISMMMASKFIYDEGVDEEVFNDEWAEAADMDLSELNQLERDFLQAIDWQLFVKRSEFFNLASQIEQRIALQQAVDRGWFSYTDLDILSRHQDFNNLWFHVASQWLQVALVSSTAYIAGVMTLVGSTILAVQVSSALTLLGTAMLTQQLEPASHVLPTSFDSSPYLPVNATEPVTMETNITAEPQKVDSVLKTRKEFDLEKDTRSVLGNIVQKLFALVTLKECMVQFVYAVSENYRSTHQGRQLVDSMQSHNQRSNCSLFGNGQSSCCGVVEHSDYVEKSVQYENSQRKMSMCQGCVQARSARCSSSNRNRGRGSHDVKFVRQCPKLSAKKLGSGKEVCLSHCQGAWPSRRGPCCLEEPPGSVDMGRLSDVGLGFTTRAHIPAILTA